jgi:hypothetical protein
LITHLVEEGHFEDEGDVRIFLRKHRAHKLTTKGRLWVLADGTLNLRSPEPEMKEVECQDGAFVLDWIVKENDFAIALMDDGREELGSVLGASKKCSMLLFLLTVHLDVPKLNNNKNKCARDHLTALLASRPDYEIESIKDIERPHDEKVGDRMFHRGNFKPTQHNLVVKLRPLSKGIC